MGPGLFVSLNIVAAAAGVACKGHEQCKHGALGLEFCGRGGECTPCKQCRVPAVHAFGGTCPPWCPMKMSVKHHESGEIMEVVATPYAATYMSVVSTEEGEEEEEEDEEGGVGAEATSGGLGCVAWRAVSGCAPEGAPRAPQDDKGCDEVVGSGSAGWCECEFEARARETGCVHEMFTCRAACATVDEGLARSHTESIEVAATTTTAEMVRAFQQAPEFVEYGSHNIMDHVRKDKPFALFML